MLNKFFKVLVILINISFFILINTELVTHPGFINKHLHINISFIIFSSFILSYISYKMKIYYKFWEYIISILLIIVIPLTIFIYSFEQFTFENNAYVKFHIFLPTLIYLLVFLILQFPVIIAYSNTKIFKFIKKQLFTVKSKYKLYIVLIILYILISIIQNMITKMPFQNIYYIATNLNATNNEKLKYQLGSKFYNYILFIKRNTPDNANILIPPQSLPWTQTSNIGYMRYFLFPRTLYNGMEYKPGINLTKNHIDYVLIDWGESNEYQYGNTNGWPKFNLNSSSVLYYKDSDSTNLNEKIKIYKYIGNYNYTIFKNKYWGIINLNK